MFSLMPRSPGAVGVCQVDLHVGVLLQPLMTRHLASLVVGHGQAHGTLEALEDVTEVLGGGLGASVLELDQGDEEGCALDQGARGSGSWRL